MELSPILLCLLAAVPVLLLIILLVGCKWSVGRAAVVSVAVDAVIALSAFGAHPLQILVSAAKGAWSSLSIILIICPAILMYNIVREAGAFRVIRAGIQQATPNKLLQILIIGYTFSAFLQGITGFGGKAVKKVLDYSAGLEGLPKADVLKFYLDGGTTLVVRPSGTEPKLKLYLSVTAKDEAEAAGIEQAILNDAEVYFR